MQDISDVRPEAKQPTSSSSDSSHLFLEDIEMSIRKGLRMASVIASTAAEMLEPFARTSVSPVGNCAADLLMAVRIGRDVQLHALPSLQIEALPSIPQTQPEIRFDPPASVDLSRWSEAVEQDPQFKRLSDRETLAMNTPMESAHLTAIMTFPGDRESQALLLKYAEGKATANDKEEVVRRRDAVWEKFKIKKTN